MTDDVWNDDGAWIVLLFICAVFGSAWTTEWQGEEETAQRLD